MIVSVVILQENGNRSTSRFSNTTFGHILIELYTLLQRPLLNNLHCSSINLSQIRNRFDVHQEIMNMWHIFTMNYYSYFLLHAQINVLFNHHKGNFHFQQMGENIRAHICTTGTLAENGRPQNTKWNVFHEKSTYICLRSNKNLLRYEKGINTLTNTGNFESSCRVL